MVKLPLKKAKAKPKEHPDVLKPYFSLGLDFNYSSSDKEVIMECPWCGKKKFSVKPVSGQWQCWACQEGSKKGGGNAYTFISVLHKLSLASTKQSDYQSLADERGFLDWETLKTWGAAKSVITGYWIFPGFNQDAKLCNLYKYAEIDGKRRMVPVPTLGTHLFGVHLYDPAKPVINICEGFMDGAMLWETLKYLKRSKSGSDLLPTSLSSGNLLSSHNVISVPGTKVFFNGWVSLCKEKAVNILFDNDHPRKATKTGRDIPPAGFEGSKRVSSILFQAPDKTGPAEVNYQKWGEDGYDPDKPNGMDVADCLKIKNRALGKKLRVKKFKEIINRLEPAPLEWADEAFEAGEANEPRVKLIECTRYSDVIDAWKVYFPNWTWEMDVTLSTMFSSIASTLAVGDQLWVRVFAPASSGKSTLCEAVSTNKTYICAKSSIRGFYTGFGDGEQSLANEASGKTLVMKEGDAFMNIPNISEVLSQGRDIYDGAARPSYRNKASKEFNCVRMTWILAGTRSLRNLDNTELGARFIDVVMLDKMSLEDEFKISLTASRRAFKEVGMEANKSNPESQYDPHLLTAYQMTGGYINYLRKNASEMLARMKPSNDDFAFCAKAALFTSCMRARPSTTNSEDEDDKELAPRLSKLFSRLAACQAFVLNKPKIDTEVMARVKKIALDTSRGKVLSLFKKLYRNPKGLSKARCYVEIGDSPAECDRMLDYLKNIDVLKEAPKMLSNGDYSDSQKVWTITPYLRKLYREVLLSNK